MTGIRKQYRKSAVHLERAIAPTNFFVRQMTRGMRLLRAAPAVLKHEGSVAGVLRKALSLYQREGVAGLKRGILYFQSMGLLKPTLASAGVGRNDYQEWIRRYDTIDNVARVKLRGICDRLFSTPKISVVMPTYNSKPEWLIEAIESVKKQIYPEWELCIADDASSDLTTRSILERYAHEDKRIKVVFREQNGHISAASNSALALATGDWVALLDHDDLLTEHALVLVAEAINRHPYAGIVYSDEDKVDENGNRYQPYFKCEWNVDLFRSQNMICHLSAYRRDLIDSVGGFREGYEGSQDYDLALRITEQLTPKAIIHIPHVLYHWRGHAESTASNAETKTYAQDAGVKALREHLQRLGIAATVELTPFLQYRVRYSVPSGLPKVSLVIPTRNGLNLIRQCINSLVEKTTYKNYEILVVDNGSDEEDVLAYLKEIDGRSKVKVIRDDRQFNYSALNNKAVINAEGDYVGLINNDLEVITPGWLDEMVSLASRPGTGAVGAALFYPDESLQHGGVITGIGGVAGHSHKYLSQRSLDYFGRTRLTQGVSVVTAACLLIKKSIYIEVGGLNEVDLQIAFNDVDFCLRVRDAGYQNVWTPFAELYHHESATRGREDTPAKRARFNQEAEYMKRTWGESLLNDPAYSPNLTLDHEDFSLAWPPRVSWSE
jgi:glycosyltransferase involved in cell wall biosynthesis